MAQTISDLQEQIAALKAQNKALLEARSKGVTISVRKNEGDDLKYGIAALGKLYPPSEKHPNGFFRSGINFATADDVRLAAEQLIQLSKTL